MPRGVGVRVPLSAQKAIVLIDSRFFAFKGTRTFGGASDDLSSACAWCATLQCNYGYAPRVTTYANIKLLSTHTHNLRLPAHHSPSRSPLGFCKRSSPRVCIPESKCLRQSISLYSHSAKRSSIIARQSLASPIIFTIPPNRPLIREACGKCSICLINQIHYSTRIICCL